MYKIGLTGGIGSGKSRVADLLAEWGAAVIDTDVIAHELTAPGGAAMEPIRQHFGPDVVAPTGALDRQAMRELVFDSPQARQQLESIIHPMIKSVVQQRAEEAQGCYLVVVVPLLVESGQWRNRLDRICVVDCDEATQIHRVHARSGLTEGIITRIMSAQATRRERLAVADDIVLNDAHTSVEQLVARTRSLHENWCKLARQAS
ncbi:dephospho-CoA kinase [Parapusillimonas granuli]|uniref:Dephospho-CoA kinase n=1 Tax=Parapusillimonas granuli TaxID=380911 RepID=A0A853FSS4_9BURK|nr:dephospho-CoA kinase [Parapusillimonas granuli]MBB5214677.1 dephospho-CoA kinase [Parapusillimonas granuli]MEB2398075.1 dephospho-CoA kinase [Alcaligenaceae bacterium]NYT48915.1 dephospho-CoA kinase [Parapusillimonas granuli]